MGRTLSLLLATATLIGCASTGKPSGEIPSGVETGIASYYGHEFHGRRTASGEVYDENKLTAAHPTLPFGTLVRVTNLENDKIVDLRVNDRGPFKKGRIIDVSYEGAKRLDFVRQGLVEVRVEVIGKE